MTTNEEMELIRKTLNKEALNDLLELSEEIKKLEADDEEIKESDFKVFFLPLLSRQVEPNEENVERFLRNIYRVSGSFSRGLKVVDDKTGEELFRVPPILIDVDDTEELLKNISFFKIINAINKVRDNIAARMTGAERVLLETRNLVKPNKEKLKKYIESVIAMEKRYGIKITERNADMPINEDKVENKQGNEDLNDVFDYD